VAVHTIGDAAVDKVIEVATSLHPQGELHIEHGELIQDSTIAKMRGLQVRVHMQPSHYLSDRIFLAEKIGPLQSVLFPWRRLQDHGVPFSGGSDSPVEPASLLRTFQALAAARAAGIAAIQGAWWEPHVHPDPNWGADCFTDWDPDSGKVADVFVGQDSVFNDL
jgi:predicted amidohydrolase YtcJ